MTLEELRSLMETDLAELTLTPNTNEYESKYREIVKAAYELDEYPAITSLESIWKQIEWDIPVLNRDKSVADSPLGAFMYYVDMGFYPPPEVMLSLLDCFQLYFTYAGVKSLDEIFFGERHMKKANPAFARHQMHKYFGFNMFWEHGDRGIIRGGKIDLKGKSQIERAELFLKSTFYKGEDIDPETFLKGYRRWKKSHGISAIRKSN